MAAEESELKALMIASLAGDAAAHHALLTRLAPLLRGYFKRRLRAGGRETTEAEDLMQETLLAIHTRRHTYDPALPVTPWVHAIARYRLIDHLRRNRSGLVVPIDKAEDVTAEDDHVATESALDLARLMSALPEKARRVITLVKLDGASVAEAATRAGMSESAVKVAVHRGLKALAAGIARGGRS